MLYIHWMSRIFLPNRFDYSWLEKVAFTGFKRIINEKVSHSLDA
jgi:hypothetical protein